MLTTEQMAHLEEAKRDCNDKQLILNTAVDIQALLRLLVDKEIISKREVAMYRKEVRESPKYAAMQMYIDQTLKEIEAYENDPQLQLKAMLDRKMKGL